MGLGISRVCKEREWFPGRGGALAGCELSAETVQEEKAHSVLSPLPAPYVATQRADKSLDHSTGRQQTLRAKGVKVPYLELHY